MKARDGIGRRLRLALALSLPALALAGCGRERDLGPPKIVYGQQECDECRMIISEERYAAGLAIDGPEGIVKQAFDDVNCMVDVLRRQSAAAIPYVHDYDTLQWLDARAAHFLHSDNLQTPMASGLASFASRAAAQKLAERFPGKVIDFDAVRGDARPVATATEEVKP